MNEENVEKKDMVSDILPSGVPELPKLRPRHHIYWAIVLILMGACLAAAFYTMYKNSTRVAFDTNPTEKNAQNVQWPTGTTQSSESTETVVQQDQAKPANEVTSDVINQIDDINNTDVTAPVGSDQVDDLK